MARATSTRCSTIFLMVPRRVADPCSKCRHADRGTGKIKEPLNCDAIFVWTTGETNRFRRGIIQQVSMCYSIPKLAYAADTNDSGAILIHQENVIWRKLAELLTELQLVTPDRRDTLID